MAKTSTIILLLCSLTSLVSISSSETCSNYSFPGNQVFASCIDLPVLQASLHWNYSQLTTKVQIAYRAVQIPRGWIAWALNPMGRGMIGSQALLAFRHSNGSMIAYSTSIASYNPPMLPSELDIPVTDISAEYVDKQMIVFGVLGPLGESNEFQPCMARWEYGFGQHSSDDDSGAVGDDLSNSGRQWKFWQ
ncbi:cytochrome b561 and DOMON domain-containing protein At5g47530-like [Hibiscus syriacus]|uniref:cytochrome b561 and DOMON domain-containing protein At5g47530-like n=1 Tax=Hibiscus syriacus TaxID=106335 RepID=UPI0019228E7E|nr:cytochrome b561 and DOMON domain-containing protein At5g47530-like [Hibiscus syriacus]